MGGKMNFRGRVLVSLALTCVAAASAAAQMEPQKPELPPEKWSGKTIMLIGAHADDDALSHGTLALLQAHGNQVYVVTLTTGNVGTQDPKLSRTQLAEIRRQEEIAALKELGIPADHYINLGYDDGLLEFEDRKAVVENLVRWIRKLRPDVLFAWDPVGTNPTIALPRIWPRTPRAQPCGACSSRARSLKRV
jgi:hypothetical protein